MRYAEKVKRDPMQSIVAHQKDENLKHFLHSKEQQAPELTGKRKAVLAIFGLTFAVMMWGVSLAGWWMAELSALFIGSSIIVASSVDSRKLRSPTALLTVPATCSEWP